MVEASRVVVGVGGGLDSLNNSVGANSSAGTWGRLVPDVRGSRGVKVGSWRCGMPLGAIFGSF